MKNDPYYGLRKETTEGTPVRPLPYSDLDVTIGPQRYGIWSWLARIFPRKAKRLVVTYVGRNDKLMQVEWTREDGKKYSGLLHAVEEDEENG
jgi:hypothetical protein